MHYAENVAKEVGFPWNGKRHWRLAPTLTNVHFMLLLDIGNCVKRHTLLKVLGAQGGGDRKAVREGMGRQGGRGQAGTTKGHRA